MKKTLNLNGDMDMVLGFQLFLTSLPLQQVAERALEEHDLSLSRAAALSLIKSNPGCGQSDLAQVLHMNRASGMKLVTTLTTRGLVERREGKDRRSIGLYLTDVGDDQLHAMIDRIREEEDHILQKISPDERTFLLRILERIRN